MNDIKDTLLLFCKEIKCFCNVDIKTEHIRRAKFNDVWNDNVAILWMVLHKLCHQLIHKRSDPYSVRSYECSVTFVKNCLAVWNYERIMFYKLPANNKYGSQELLIALAWLLAKKQGFDKLITYKIWQFRQGIRSVYKNIEKINSYKSMTDMKFEDNINKILLLCGELKYNLNCVNHLNEEHNKLVDKIHKETLPINGVPHLSLDEARLFLKDNHQILKSMAELQSLINIHRKWKEKSCVFWRWMDTVLEEACLHTCISNGNNEHLIEFLKVLITRLNSKLKSADKYALSGSSEANIIPRLILSPEGNEKNPSELKILQEIVYSELSSNKKLIQEMEVVLYRKIRSIR